MTTVPGHITHVDPMPHTAHGWPNHDALHGDREVHGDRGVHDFLTLSDGVVRRLLDVQLRLDEAGAVFDDAHSTFDQLSAAHGDVRSMVAALEEHLRSTNVAMLGITSDWPMNLSGRGAPASRTISTTG